MLSMMRLASEQCELQKGRHSMGEQPVDLNTMWQKVIKIVQQGDINRSLWDALAAAVPIAIEDDTLALGFKPLNMKFTGYLKTPGNESQVRKAVEQAVGRRLTIETIEGETLDAWERYKARRVAAEEAAIATMGDAVKHRDAAAGWMDVSQQTRKLYYEIAGREKPLGHARYLIKIIPIIAKAEDDMRQNEPEADELHEREMDKIFDRIGSLCGIPAGLVALEYLRYKGSRKKA